MRGQRAFDIPIPNGGVRADQPDHAVDPAAIPAYLRPTATQLVTSGNSPSVVTQAGSGFTGIGNYNTCIAMDGLLRVRPNVGFITNNGADRTMAIATGFSAGSATVASFRMITIGINFIINSSYFSGGLNNTVVAMGIAQHTTADTAVRTIPWLQSGSFNWLWVNQGVQWPNQTSLSLNPSDGLSAYNVDSNTFTKVGGFPIPSAADITSLLNRVVVVNSSTGSSLATPGRVQWSAVNDYTTWPAGAFQDLQDGSIDPIIAVRRTSQTSAILFRTNSAWIMYGVTGTDATAFSFERIVACDGMPGPCSPAAVVEAEGQYYYMGNDGRCYNFNGSSITWISGPVDPIMNSTIDFQTINRSFAVYNPTLKQILFFYTFNTQGGVSTGNPSVCLAYNLRTGNWDGLWGYAEAANFFFSSGAAVMDFEGGGTIAGNGLYGCFLGSAATLNFARFNGHGGQDTAPGGAGSPILARYTSPMFRMDNLHSMLGDSIQLFLKQGYTSESVTVVVEGFQNPYDVAPLTQASFTYDLFNVTGFASKFPPPAKTIRGNWVRISLFSNNIPGQMAFGGGTMWVDPDEMGDSNRTS